MDLKEIKSVIDLMTKNGLSEFELEKGDFKLRVKRGPNGEWSSTAVPTGVPQVVHHHAPVGAFAAPAAPVALPPTSVAPAAGAPPAAANADNLKIIPSLMLGTFYVAPSPDSPTFVSVGQEVNEETVVCIIEAMKVMNEIKADMKGVIVEVLAENGKKVEYNTPLFSVRPL